MSDLPALVVACSLIWAGAALADADSETATYWRTEDNATIVEFDHCGEEYCGKIVAILDDQISRSDAMALCDLQIVGALLPEENDTWFGGWLLDPETESFYKLTVRIEDAAMTLRVFETVESWSVVVQWSQVERPAVFCHGNIGTESW